MEQANGYIQGGVRWHGGMVWKKKMVWCGLVKVPFAAMGPSGTPRVGTFAGNLSHMCRIVGGVGGALLVTNNRRSGNCIALKFILFFGVQLVVVRGRVGLVTVIREQDCAY
jgi:hypothetical protein